jgi:hypothetical protein
MTLAEILDGELPWWSTAFAAVLLSLAAAVARRITRRSARPQGERLGQIERLVESERTRRRQAERELYERYGVEPRPAPRPYDDEDRADEPADARTRSAPSIPPLPDYPQHRRERLP